MNIKVIKRIISAAAAAVVCTAFSACGFGTTIDTLLTAPMMTDEQEEIFTALKDSAGNEISLVYPRSGAYRSAFVFADLDSDSQNEAMVFYSGGANTHNAESGVRVNILDRGEDGWHSVYDHAGAGTYIEQVFFTYPGGTGKLYLAIGYGYMTPTEKTLRLYSFSDGALSTEYSGSYYRTLTLDLDRDGGEDIAVINCNNENHSAYAELITDKGEGARCTSRVELSADTAEIASVISGFIGENTPALFIDGLMGSGSLSTEIVYCVNGQLRNPAALSGSEIPSLTMRSAGLYCRDIDGDGIVEIPSREPFPGYRDVGEIQYITNWTVFENYTVVKKYSSLTVPASGYCFMLPVRWEGLVTVKNDSVTGEKVFYKYNSSLSESRLELMRILVCPLEEEQLRAAEGYFTAATDENAAYMIRLGDTDDNLLLTSAEVNNNFYLW